MGTKEWIMETGNTFVNCRSRSWLAVGWCASTSPSKGNRNQKSSSRWLPTQYTHTRSVDRGHVVVSTHWIPVAGNIIFLLAFCRCENSSNWIFTFAEIRFSFHPFRIVGTRVRVSPPPRCIRFQEAEIPFYFVAHHCCVLTSFFGRYWMLALAYHIRGRQQFETCTVS